MGSGVLVPATYAWGESTVQTLQTFGILLSVFKMVRAFETIEYVEAACLLAGDEGSKLCPHVPPLAPPQVLFALIINAVGAVNSVPQVGAGDVPHGSQQSRHA